MRRRFLTSSIAATGLVAAIVLGGATAPASADTSYPSWDDVQRAKANTAAAAAEVSRINALLSGLRSAAAAAGDLAVKRAGEYGIAQANLQKATQKADDLAQQSTAADAKAAELRTQSGKFAAQLARSGSSDVSLRLFLNGGQRTSGGSTSLLYQLGTVSRFADQASSLFAQATEQKNVAAALSQQATAAKKVRDTLAAAAEKALEVAQQAKAAAAAKVADEQSHANTLYAQLATLKNTQAATEKSYAEGEAARQAAEAAANPGGGADGSAPPPGIVVDPAAAQAYAASRLGAFGWGGDQMDCLIKLWNHESGWRADAYNTSSGAYGIPQAWPGSKMATAGADWMTNANTQINWGLDYINRAYGSPCAAWTFEMTHDPNWY